MPTCYIVKSTPAKLDKLDLVSSTSVHDVFADEEINSLRQFKEIMGIACVDKNGTVTKNVKLRAVSDHDSAESKDSIAEIGNKCSDDIPIWWHTHAAALSSMSSEDRLSAGNLKHVLDNDITCAIGINGYSCHDVSSSPPRVKSVDWKDTFFNKIRNSDLIGDIIDLRNDWKFDIKKESDMYQINCYTKDGVLICTGIDWDTGFKAFPIGAFNNVIMNGDIAVRPDPSGFRLQGASINKKLECMTIKPGTAGFRVLVCK